MAIGDKTTHVGGWQVLVNFDAGWGIYRSIYPSNLTKTVLYLCRGSQNIEVTDYEWGKFTGFNRYWY